MASQNKFQGEKIMEQIKLFIIDSEEATASYKKEMEEDRDLMVVGAVDNGNAIKEIIEETMPDLVVLDLLLPGRDGFEVISEIKSVSSNVKIIVTSALNSSVFVNKAMELGVDYFMIKPVECSSLIKRIKEIVITSKKNEATHARKLEEKITNIFLTVGIPAHIKGYQFLREAIKMAVDDPRIINSITKRLYPGIAEIYDTTASKVERAIRHAIEVAWNKGKIENINDVFGLRVYDTHEKPTNGEFIALVTDKMLLENY